ncbi:MAG: hypothetical protein R3C28_29145 [Pirellulaceae bacterium]
MHQRDLLGDRADDAGVKAKSKCPLVDAIEINLKGGQVGAVDYFVQLRDGV